jgi:hypothetical protein
MAIPEIRDQQGNHAHMLAHRKPFHQTKLAPPGPVQHGHRVLRAHHDIRVTVPQIHYKELKPIPLRLIGPDRKAHDPANPSSPRPVQHGHSHAPSGQDVRMTIAQIRYLQTHSCNISSWQ